MSFSRRSALQIVLATAACWLCAAVPAAAARRTVIGASVQGRPIVAWSIGSDRAPRKVLVVGCIHGNECAGLAITNALKRSRVPAGVQLWIVPEMNPDGTAAGTRQNAHGVDLNRNFPWKWRPISDPVYFSGPRPSSEPETRAAIGLIRRIRPAVTVWYHQHMDLVDEAGGDLGVPRRYAQIAGLRPTCLTFLSGVATRWSNQTFPHTTAFVVELPAGAVPPAALARHLRAVRAMELAQRSGSATRCDSTTTAALAHGPSRRTRARRPSLRDARVSATFAMRGRIVTAVRVRGEYRGERISRRWSFVGQSCAGNICRRLVLMRQRSAGQTDQLVLHRTGAGRYAGNGQFYAALECRGELFAQGELVRYRVTAAITRTVSIQGARYATGLSATYVNARRIDRTICPVGPSHDAATYTGAASPPPGPPTAGFSYAGAPGSDTVAFTSSSTPGGDNQPLTTVQWQFGDPNSGAANSATGPQVSHAFSGPGTYTVSVTATDAAGLTATQSQQVVVTGS